MKCFCPFRAQPTNYIKTQGDALGYRQVALSGRTSETSIILNKISRRSRLPSPRRGGVLGLGLVEGHYDDGDLYCLTDKPAEHSAEPIEPVPAAAPLAVFELHAGCGAQHTENGEYEADGDGQ